MIAAYTGMNLLALPFPPFIRHQRQKHCIVFKSFISLLYIYYSRLWIILKLLEPSLSCQDFFWRFTEPMFLIMIAPANLRVFRQGKRIWFQCSVATACFSWKPTDCLKGFSTRFSRLERDARYRGAFVLKPEFFKKLSLKSRLIFPILDMEACSFSI